MSGRGQPGNRRSSNIRRDNYTGPRGKRVKKTPSNIVASEKAVAEENAFVNNSVPGNQKANTYSQRAPRPRRTYTKPTGPINSHNRKINYHRKKIRSILRRRNKIKTRLMGISNASAAPNSTASEGSAMLGDPISESTRRYKIFALGVQNIFYSAARGWYAAIRKSCIAYGPKSYNDKYFTDQINRNDDPQISEAYNLFNNSHTCMINFLYQTIMANYNYLITQDVNKLLTRLPEHISFLVHTTALKYLVRVRNGIVNLACRLPTQTIAVTEDHSVKISYIDPTLWMAQPIITSLLNQLYAIQQHNAYPFQTTDKPSILLKDIIVHDKHGSADKTDLHMNEIVSVYGYATAVSGSRYYGNYFYELSGLAQNSITNIYRTLFFPVFEANTIDQSNIPDYYNIKKMDDYFYDNLSYAVYFGLVGKVATSDFCYVAELPQFNNDGDLVRSPDNSSELVSVNNKGLNYLLQKYNSNNTRPAPFKPANRGVPNFPEVSFSPHAYNLALFMAQVMQSRYQLFAQKPAVNPDFNDDMDAIYANTLLSYFSPINEGSFSIGVYCMQYDNRFTLPSPIIEQFKPINSYNTWSYTDSTKSITMQLLLNCARADLTATNTPNNGGLFMLKGGTDVPGDASFYNIKNLYQSYDGITYQPYNYDEILAGNDFAMAELRPYVKLNNCPEIENPLPSMHVMYHGFMDRALGLAFSEAVYTPLDKKAFHDKNMNVFIKYTVLPEVTIAPGINIPLLNVTNLVMSFSYDDRPIFNLYQMSFVASYSGPSSEMDLYYSMLRKTMIGSWSDAAPLVASFTHETIGQIMNRYPQTAPYINEIFDLINTPQVRKRLPKMGAYGDFINMIGTPVRNVTNYDENGYNAVNVQPPPPNQQPKKHSFWSGLWDGIKTFGPTVMKYAPQVMELMEAGEAAG